MFRKSLILLIITCLMSISATAADLYACGSWQNWEPWNAEQFTLGEDGIYSLTIDFSAGTNFKMSTVKPSTTDQQQAWIEFDAGTLQPVSDCQLNRAVNIVSGLDNIIAPEATTLTVLVNLADNQMAFSDGTTSIDWNLEDMPGPDPEPGVGYYACGSWQGWDPSKAEAFVLGDDGMYRLTVDFSAGTYFKMSTVRPEAGDVGAMWTAFDSGAFQYETQPALYEPAVIVSGVDNCVAPLSTTLTIVINPARNLMGFTDGQRDIDWSAIVSPDPWSGALPVLFIDTESHAPIVSKEEYLKATYYLDPMGIEGVEAFGSAEEPLTLQIKGRGNYTWTGFDKKPYRLKLDSKAALLGMKKSKHFVLLAHADDTYGFMRNAVGFELSRRAGLDWTPSDQPIEVVLNGEYIGLYFLTENIRIDKDRVNIFEQPEGDASTDVTGGWLVEIDNYDSDPHVSLRSVDGYELWFTHKTPELVNDAQYDFLYDEMYAIDRAVFASDKSVARWFDYIDVPSLINFYIVQELMDNYESFHGSCYIHRDIDNAELSADGLAEHKWKFGPVWDFGSSFVGEKSQYIYQGRPWHQAWIGEMCTFPQFMSALKTRWLQFYPSQYGDMDTFVDDFATRIHAAALADAKRWPAYGNSDIEWDATVVKSRLADAADWLCEQWGRSASAADITASGIDVKVIAGHLVITAPQPMTISVARVDGTVFTLDLVSGTNTFDLPRGFYIVGGSKVAL